MKRLTLTLWSCLLLFLGIGTAWAQTLTTPTFTPATGATVTPGSEITFTLPNDLNLLEYQNVAFIFYVENDDVVVLECDDYNKLMPEYQGEPLPYSVGIYNAETDDAGETIIGGEWQVPVTISTTASGEVKFRARLAVMVANDDGMGFLYSNEMTATYTASGTVEKPVAPAFSLLDGTSVEGSSMAVTAGTQVKMSEPAEGISIYYVKNGADTDFTGLTTPTDLSNDQKLKGYDKDQPITIEESVTIKAAAVRIGSSLVWSDITTVEFKLKPAKPEITSDRDYAHTGFLRLGDQVELSCTTEGAEIYYTLDGSEPTAESTKYTEAIVLAEEHFMKVEGVVSLNLKAIAVLGANSEPITFTMPIAIEKLEFRVAGAEDEEALWSGATEVATGATVKLTTQPAGLDIYYTTDGTIPTKESTQYIAEGITIDKSQIILAVAYNGELMSYDPEWGDTPEAYAFLIKTGDGETATVNAEVFAALTFTPATGATVKAGQELNFAVPEGLAWSSSALSGAYMFYTDKDGVELECTAEDLLPIINPWMYGPGEPLPFYIGMYDAMPYEGEPGWTSEYPVVVPEDATGTITFKARFAVMIGESLVYSPVMTATYTVDGAVEKPTVPAFYMGEDKIEAAKVEVEFGAEVTLANGYPEDDNLHMMYYKVNGTAADFTTDLDALQDYENPPLTPFYGDPIVMAKSQTILAATAKLNMATKKVTWSDIVTVEFTVKDMKAEKPTFDPAAGAVAKGTNLTWTWDESYADEFDQIGVIYVAEGEDADLNLTATEILQAYENTPEDDTREDGTVYVYLDGDDYGYKIDKAVTVKARFFAMMVDPNYSSADQPGDEDMILVFSDVETAAYTLNGEQVDPEPAIATPVITPGSGEVEKGQEVTITCATTGAYIMYTLDGTTPTMASSVYREGTPIVIDSALTLKAAAAVQGKWSEVATAVYTIKGGTTDPEKDTVATPTFSVPAGEVAKGTKVEIACATDSVKLYYTVDGSEPTAESTEYTAAITIDKAMTIKAIAIKGEVKSAVAEAAYTVKEVANEELELAGVSVYPNPSNGVFTLELPVAARVEVYGLTGVMVQRFEAGAGLVMMNIDHSGIYFLRITAEGRTTVKRIVVR